MIHMRVITQSVTYLMHLLVRYSRLSQLDQTSGLSLVIHILTEEVPFRYKSVIFLITVHDCYYSTVKVAFIPTYHPMEGIGHSWTVA